MSVGLFKGGVRISLGTFFFFIVCIVLIFKGEYLAASIFAIATSLSYIGAMLKLFSEKE